MCIKETRRRARVTLDEHDRYRLRKCIFRAGGKQAKERRKLADSADLKRGKLKAQKKKSL